MAENTEVLPQLTNEDQLWILQQVKEGKMTQEDALRAARKKASEGVVPLSRSPTIDGSSKRTAGKKAKPPSVSSAKLKDVPAEVGVISSPIIPLDVQNTPLGRGENGSPESGRQQRKDSATNKCGDEERLFIFDLVKSGRMTVDDAVKYAEDHGLSGSAKREADAIAATTSALTEQKCYNFAVYKMGRFRTPVRRILQIDFRNKIISYIQKGNVTKKYDFAQVVDYDCQEGVYFTIYLSDDSVLDMDADSLEERNEISGLLKIIIKLNAGDAKMEREYAETLPELQKIIKEGELEKKGKGLTGWVRRWVRVRYGELSYYRPQEETALNIVQLIEGTTAVKKVDHNGFILMDKFKQFAFRIISVDHTPAQIQDERDQWVKVILNASHGIEEDAMVPPLSPTPLTTVPGQQRVNVGLQQLCQELEAMKEQLRGLQVPESVIGQAERMVQMASQLEMEPTTTGLPVSREKVESRQKEDFAYTHVDDSRIYAEIDKRWKQRISNHDVKLPSVSESDDVFEPQKMSESLPEVDQKPPDAIADLPPRKISAQKPVPTPRRKHPPCDAPGTTEIIPQDATEVPAVTEVPSTTSPLVPAVGVVPSVPTPPTVPMPPAPPLPPGVPPPPAAPGFMDKLLPGKKLKQTSKTKLRPFHGSKVPKVLYNKSMWKTASDLSDKIDITVLEKEFTASKDVSQTTASPAQKDKLKSLLDPKRAQNLGIVLSGFKMSTDELESRLNYIKPEEGALPMDQIGMLRRLQPTSDDIDMYKNFKGNRRSLEPADQFMMQLCGIPNLSLRLDALVAISELPAQIEEVEPAVYNMNDACSELLTSHKFHTVLEYVLAVGNVLNQSCGKGISDGFQLSSLTKLADMKGKERKYNLLVFLIEQMTQRQPDLVNFHEEVSHVTSCCDVSVKGLTAEIEVMKKDVNKIQKNAKMLKKARASCSSLDKKFQMDVQEFVSDYEQKLRLVNEKCLKTQSMYKKTLEFFGESTEKDSDEFFSCLSEFIKVFKQTVEEEERKKSSSTSNPNKALAAAFLSGRVGQNKGPSFNVNPLAPKTNKNQDPPTKEGFLDKLSGGKHRSPKWDKRFFEVASTGHLHYFKKKFDKNLGSVYLKGCPISLEDEQSVIFIDTAERDFKIKAETVEETREWYNVLCYYGKRQ